MLKNCVMAAVLVAGGAIVACSGSNGSGGGPYDSCVTSLLGSSCTSCLQSKCGDALGGLESGCSDYFGCICPGGNFSAPNAQSSICSSKAQESSCVSSLTGDAGAAACTACQSACSQGGASSSSGNNFGSTSGSGSGAPNGNGGTSSSSGSSSGGSGFGSSSGSSSGNSGTGSSSGGSSDCAGTLLPGSSAVTLSLTGVDFGDATTTDWMTIGYDLDGLCTTASSTNVCGLAAGASLQAQDDGSNGIDNSYGENLCPIFDTLSGPGSCSTKLAQVYLQIDANGNGTLVVGSGSTPLVYPVQDVHIALNGSGGMAGGVIPTAGLTAAWQNVAGCISTSLCSGSAIQSILTQLAQASDIGADGSNTAGAACSGVSFGLEFTGSTPVTSIPSAPTCPCQ